MPELEKPQTSDRPAQPFRMDVQIHDLLMKPAAHAQVHPALQPPTVQPLTLPEPVYPRGKLGEGEAMSLKAYQRHNALRSWRGWGVPYFKSLFHPGELRPLISYLFSE